MWYVFCKNNLYIWCQKVKSKHKHNQHNLFVIIGYMFGFPGPDVKPKLTKWCIPSYPRLEGTKCSSVFSPCYVYSIHPWKVWQHWVEIACCIVTPLHRQCGLTFFSTRTAGTDSSKWWCCLLPRHGQTQLTRSHNSYDHRCLQSEENTNVFKYLKL